MWLRCSVPKGLHPTVKYRLLELEALVLSLISVFSHSVEVQWELSFQLRLFLFAYLQSVYGEVLSPLVYWKQTHPYIPESQNGLGWKGHLKIIQCLPFLLSHPCLNSTCFVKRLLPPSESLNSGKCYCGKRPSWFNHSHSHGHSHLPL